MGRSNGIGLSGAGMSRRTFDLRAGAVSNLRSRSHQCAWHQRDYRPNRPMRDWTDVSRFCNASAFASWLGLCPENRISGGKVLYTKSRRVRTRVATALRMAANSLHHAKDDLGEFFRRIARKLGKPQAITATAHKLELGRVRGVGDTKLHPLCEQFGKASETPCLIPRGTGG